MNLEFEWDEAKAESNFRKHGIDFDYAIGIFEGFTIEDEDDRQDHRKRPPGRLHSAGTVPADYFRAESEAR